MSKPRLRPAAADLYGASMQDTAHIAAGHDDPGLHAWYPYAGSADADLIDELDTIRPRSRDLTRNNGYASGADQTLRDNIVGAHLRLAAQPDGRLLGWDRDRVREWVGTVEPKFATWANDPWEIDAGRSLGLLGLTLQALGGWFLNGESFAIAHWQPRNGARWNTRVQVIEADRIETPPNLTHRRDIKGGIRIDRYGAPLSYFVRTTHPGDDRFYNAPQYRRIPSYTDWGRRRVIHLHDKERTGQSRGKPLVTAIMREFRMAGQYTNTELQTAVSNSLIAAFLKSDLSQDQSMDLLGVDAQGSYEDYWRNSINNWRPTLKSGAVIPLPPSASIEPFQPDRPNNAFEGFILSVLRNIASGLNIPYELLAKDFSKTNYSSARAALLEAWRYFQGRRRWLMDYWLGPIYELWIEEAVNAAEIEAPGYYENRYAYRRSSWIMSGRGWVDPSKEADAAGKRLGHNITTLRQECAEQGLDYEEVLEQRAEEYALMERLGIPVAAAPSPESSMSPTGNEN